MASAGGLLGTAVSGLLAFQRNLATTGNNITNVNTEGYSRQSVEMAARTPSITSSGFVGAGVSVTTIKRVFDQFLFDEVTSRNASFSQLDVLQNFASRIDELLGSEQAGLSPAIQEFFNAMQDVGNNPTSAPARQVLISQAETLVNRFRSLDDRFESLRSTVNAQMEVMTGEVSSIASSIAELNRVIMRESGRAGGQPPNDLLDKRDSLVNRLSELVAVNTVSGEDGALNVFIGNGQSLVLGAQSNTIGVTKNAFDQSEFDVSFSSSTQNFSINGQISGGKLGGLLQLRRQVLDPSQNAMGRIAIGLADSVNVQHQLGDDINGNPGGQFFNAVVTTSPEVLANANNDPASGTISLTINDTSVIQASDYRLNYDGATFTLTRLEDNAVVDSGFTLADLPRTVASDGISLDLAGSVVSGDSFLLRPVRNGARNVAVAITDPALVAAAARGNALGDNSNALLLAGLQAQKTLGSGTETFQTAFSRIVASIGVRTNEAKVNADAQRTLLKRAVDAQQSVSGVNLDEEAANLLRFQQAYQAAAQVVSVSNDLFQTLLRVTSR
ncbi:MAG: flagellar hook-associated protein FlgK [Gammaproteobacteria bacterium]|nr:flagellar hook-associated protein FlgK [Gammaproteobacteria bacterium]